MAPQTIASIGVVGAGAMGRGIAQVIAAAGMNVAVFDMRANAAAEAVAFAADMLKRQAEKGRMSAEDAAAATARLRSASALPALSSCDMIAEAIVEDLRAKQELFRGLDAIVTRDAILASNTSSLSITEIAAGSAHPERVIGLHFFNPVPLMALVEIVPGLRTSETTLQRATALVQRIGKTGVRTQDMPGFLVNHVGRGFGPEALRILGEGVATAPEIDAIMRAAGFRMGPFELLDLTGLDVSQPVMEQVYRQFFDEPMYRPSIIGRRRMAAGLLGRKSGAGFYAYPAEKPAATQTEAAEPAHAIAVWLDPRDSERFGRLSARLKQAGAKLAHDAPRTEATLVIAPPAGDATTAAVARGLDPRRVVAVDTWLESERISTIMKTPLTEPERLRSVRALLAREGETPVIVNDSPGFVAPRIVAMLINIACTIAQQRIAAPADIDLGARLGLAYPKGPLEWGDSIGPGRVLEMLAGLYAFYGDPRYRPSPWLKRRAMLGVSLLTPD
jgi:3-hydroxybutyryl-CoA dehydrogenase